MVPGGKYGRIGRIFCSGCGFCLSREGYFGIEMVVFVWKWGGFWGLTGIISLTRIRYQGDTDMYAKDIMLRYI